MRITVSTDSVAAQFAGRITAMSAQASRAFVQGLNEGGDLQRTSVRRDLKEQTGVKRYGAILARTGFRRASAGNLVYTLLGMGKGMPITEFPVTASARSPVTARPWNVAHTFKRSFKTSVKGLLRARLGAGRLPIRGLNGPAVSKEIVQGETASHFQATAAPHVQRAVMKRLGRLLP